MTWRDVLTAYLGAKFIGWGIEHIGKAFGWKTSWSLTEIRRSVRCRRDNVRQEDVIAAIEAAALASDLRLVRQLSERYLLQRCANCAQPFDRERSLGWAVWSTSAIPYPQEPGPRQGFRKIKRNDPDFDVVYPCERCWMIRPPGEWFAVVIVEA